MTTCYAQNKNIQHFEYKQNASDKSDKDTNSKNWKQGADQKVEKKLKFTYKEQIEYQNIEGEISNLEERLETIEKEITANTNDFVKLQKLYEEKEELTETLANKMDRWMYLEDLAARIAEQ